MNTNINEGQDFRSKQDIEAIILSKGERRQESRTVSSLQYAFSTLVKGAGGFLDFGIRKYDEEIGKPHPSLPRRGRSFQVLPLGEDLGGVELFKIYSVSSSPMITKKNEGQDYRSKQNIEAILLSKGERRKVNATKKNSSAFPPLANGGRWIGRRFLFIMNILQATPDSSTRYSK